MWLRSPRVACAVHRDLSWLKYFELTSKTLLSLLSFRVRGCVWYVRLYPELPSSNDDGPIRKNSLLLAIALVGRDDDSAIRLLCGARVPLCQINQRLLAAMNDPPCSASNDNSIIILVLWNRVTKHVYPDICASCVLSPVHICYTCLEPRLYVSVHYRITLPQHDCFHLVSSTCSDPVTNVFRWYPTGECSAVSSRGDPRAPRLRPFIHLSILFENPLHRVPSCPSDI